MFKPEQLVQVDYRHPTYGVLYTAVGEVMSFQTPDDTLMVRRVPGEPTTLEEMKLVYTSYSCNIRTLEYKVSWVHFAKIKGNGRYSVMPYDMLRYDHAAPFNFHLEQDEALGDGLVLRRDDPPEQGLIIAKVCAHERQDRWTPERWLSFGWSIEPLATKRIWTRP